MLLPWTQVVAMVPLLSSPVYVTWFYRPAFTGPSQMPGYFQWPPLCHSLILHRRSGWSILSALCFPHDHRNQGSIKETRVRCSSVTLSVFSSWRSHLRKLVPSSRLFWSMVFFSPTSHDGEVQFAPMVWNGTISSCSHKLSVGGCWLFPIKNNPS